MNRHQNLKIGFKDLGYGWFVLELPSSCPLSSWFNLNLRIQIWTSDVRSESWTNLRMLFVNQSKILTPVRQAAKIKEKSSVVMAWHKFESYNAGNQRTEQVLSLVVAASSVNVSKYSNTTQGISFKKKVDRSWYYNIQILFYLQQNQRSQRMKSKQGRCQKIVQRTQFWECGNIFGWTSNFFTTC